jgi:hypothetical protein
MDDELILKAVEAIRTYLNARPAAADTVEGIHYYWIDWDGEPELLAVTEAALLHLEQNNFVEHTQAGSRMVWRRRSAAN